LTNALERGNRDEAERIYATGNLIFASCALAGMACICAILSVPYWAVALGILGGATDIAPIALLALGAMLRIAACGAYSLYRANRQYARLAFILAFGELFRIAITAAVVASGGDILYAAAATLLGIAVPQFFFVVYDTSNRYPPHRFAFAVPSRKELQQALGISSGYFAQNVPVLILLHVPVLALAYVQAGPGAVSVFVLIRTVTGFPRAIIQALGVVAGQECGRRVAVGDGPGAFATLEHSARAFSAMSGLAAGLLFAAGGVIGTLWVGKENLMQQNLIAAGLFPMLLTPVTMVAQNVIACTNKPLFGVLGRWMQLFVTLFAALWVPVPDLPMRALIALSLGEAAGYAPLAYVGLWQIIPRAKWSFHWKAFVVGIASAVCGYFVTGGLLDAIEPNSGIEGLLTLGASAAVCGLAFSLLGFERHSRKLFFLSLAGSVTRSSGSAYPIRGDYQ
jgi:O-antigen/teichoic acid export membrane protein